MAYHSLTALGDDSGDLIEKCTKQIKSADLDTKGGREQSVKTGAACAADGFCAAYKVPPGVCGPIAKTVAGEAIKVWNSIFGDDRAQREALRKQKESAAYFAQLANVSETDRAMTAERLKLVGALIGLHDQLIPSRKGELGNMSAYRWTAAGWERQSSSSPIIGTGEAPMLKLLAEQGMAHRVTPQGWIHTPDAFYLGAMQGQVASLAAQERQKRLAACAEYDQFCLNLIPSQRALETKILGTFAADNAARFFDSLDQAALKARAAIAAKAVAERLRQQTKTSAQFSKKFAAAQLAQAGMMKAGACILVAGAAAAALIIYRRK